MPYFAMSPLSQIRRRTRAHAHNVLALFAVVWMSVALQPCAMAFGTEPVADCDHCPAAVHEAAHHQVADAAGTGPHAGHVAHDNHPAGHTANGGDATSCDPGISDCYVDRDTPLEKRHGVTTLDDGDRYNAALFAIVDLPTVLPQETTAMLASARRALSIPSPAVSELFCIYLD